MPLTGIYLKKLKSYACVCSLLSKRLSEICHPSKDDYSSIWLFLSPSHHIVHSTFISTKTIRYLNLALVYAALWDKGRLPGEEACPIHINMPLQICIGVDGVGKGQQYHKQRIKIACWGFATGWKSLGCQQTMENDFGNNVSGAYSHEKSSKTRFMSTCAIIPFLSSGLRCPTSHQSQPQVLFRLQCPNNAPTYCDSLIEES